MRNLTLLTLALALSQTGVVLYLSFAALTGYWLAEQKALATLPLALQFAGMALVALPVAQLMQRFGRRACFMLGQGVGALGAVLACVSVWQHDFELFCAAALLIGAHNAIWQHFRFAAVECVDADNRSLAVACVLSGGVVAAFLGTPLALWGEHWLPVLYAGGYAAMAGLCLINLLILMLLRLEPAPRPQPGEDRLSARSILGRPGFLTAALFSSLSFALMAFVMNATPLAMQLHGFEGADSSRVIQLHTLGMFAPSLLTGVLIRWKGRTWTLCAGLLCFLVAVMINLTGTAFFHFATALTLVGLGWNLVFISATDLLTACHGGHDKERVQAVHDLIMFSVVGVSNYFAGAWLLLLGWEGLNQIVLIPLGITLLLIACGLFRAPLTAIPQN